MHLQVDPYPKDPDLPVQMWWIRILLHYFWFNCLELMNEIIEVWQPSHQSWLLNNSAKVAGIFATLPAIYLSLRMRYLIYMFCSNIWFDNILIMFFNVWKFRWNKGNLKVFDLLHITKFEIIFFFHWPSLIKLILIYVFDSNLV
jgi:hypothetical protein